ncbi:MAG: site-specific DNA-methyltransferase [bacterium]|nr:site-specific DNA-methyltransferase [bacterium]
MSKENSIDQLKFFLKEMFQFNANDLDFGIYRIYNLKRKEIENFIDGKDEQCLEPIINKTLELVSNIEKQVELTSLTTYLKKFNQESLANEPSVNFTAIQTLIDFSKDDIEKDNLSAALTASTKEFNITDEIKDKIYNHILGYFEMYYSNGDFGYNNRSRSLYKVPYEADYDGNDTMFHWKHKGSLYIKTGNSFNAIKFKLKHLDKEFELRLETNEDSTGEETARNNNKDTKLKHYKFNRFEEKDGVTRIVFNLSDSSTTKAKLFEGLFKDVFKSKEKLENYLFADGKPVYNDLTDDYDKVQDGSVKGIVALRVNRKTLLNKINKNFERGSKIEIVSENGQEHFSDKTLETIYNIDQKLNSFYIGNDSDYFIHENLQEFLTQEKERYIKNHILSDLKSILDGKLDNTTLIIAKAFESVSSRIIDFLSSIEEFQKKLFTMKKKVVESEYCLTIDNIDEKFYEEILDNKAQLAEWEKLFSLKVKTLADMKGQPTLVLDTKFFKQIDGSNPFKDKILAEIENLDERTNGVLVNSENYQALNLIEERYNGKINCNYIDPPYNTGASEILYKNHFRHSSWLTIMHQNLLKSKSLLHKDGLINCAIDDFEVQNLGQLMNEIFGIENRLGYLIIEIKPSGRTNDEFLATSHEYILTYAKKKENVNINFIELTETKKAEYKYSDDISAYKWRDFLRTGGYSTPRERPNSFYPIYLNPETEDVSLELGNGFVKIEPIDSDGKQRVWRKTRPSFLKHLKVGDIKIEKTNGDYKVRIKDRIKVGSRPKSVWVGAQYDASSHGTKLLKKLFGKSPFSFSKSLYAVIETINLSTDSQSLILDQFAGSGTTGHAVIKINKVDEEEGLRKYILVEVGKYFDSVTKTRIQKVIYSDNWKDGKPINNDGSTIHIFKYFVLEQYEDILDAIEQYEGETPKNLPLKYLYKPELNKINSTLNLSKPFSNKIKYGQPTKEGFVDLVDTYNYLEGYEVKGIKTYTVGKKYYKVVETNDTLVVWRDIALGEDDSKAIIEIAGKYPKATQIEVNYDFNILATLKDKQLQVGKRVLGLNIIHADIFNQ